jgi:subtilisin
MQLAIKRAPGVAAGAAIKSSIQINVLDSIHENGAKLVAINNKEMPYFRFSYPGLRIIPEKFYDLAFRQEMIDEGATASAARRTVGLTARIECLDENGDPVKDVTIVAFTDFAAKAGASGTTNSSGIVNLTLPSKKIERMYAYPSHSSWGLFQQTFTMPAKLSITLQSIQPGSTDGLRHFYPTRSWPAVTARVRVGIIDTGFGPHKDITIHSAVNMVSGEDPADFRDRNGHGTHVAGIIGAKGDFTGVAKRCGALYI